MALEAWDNSADTRSVVHDSRPGGAAAAEDAGFAERLELRAEPELTRRPLGGAAKRAFDIGFAALALVLIAPVLLVIALAIRLESPGPALFRQYRGGLHGAPFKIWKFRTMHVVEDGWAARQAERDDARTTLLGRFLRKASLDEFPQLLNVLSGEMSIVGPRPHVIHHDLEFAVIDPRYGDRFTSRPGMTGLAQVSGCRGPTSANEAVRARVDCDLAYIADWSLSLDANIIGRTFRLLWSDPFAF